MVCLCCFLALRFLSAQVRNLTFFFLSVVLAHSMSLFTAEVALGLWACPQGPCIEYDGAEDGLLSLRQEEYSGSTLIFSRWFCDTVVNFLYTSRSSDAAATSFLESLRSGLACDCSSMSHLAGLMCPHCSRPPTCLFPHCVATRQSALRLTAKR